MEGLEISVVKLSEVKGEFRIEAEHYQHKYQKLLERLNKDFSYLKDLVSKPIQTRLLRVLSASFMQPAAVVMPCMLLIRQRMLSGRFLFSSMPQRFLTEALYQVK